MKLKKRGNSGEILVIVILVLVLGGVVASVIHLVNIKGTEFAKSSPKEDCKERTYYADKIITSYKENKNNALEFYLQFKDCYATEEPSVPDEIRLFLKAKEAESYQQEGYNYDALYVYFELLNKYPENRELMVKSVNGINSIYNDFLKSEKEKPKPDKSIILQILNKKLNHLNEIYKQFVNKKGHQVPLDLVLLYIGDAYSVAGNKQYALENYKKAVEDYPVKDNATGQGFYTTVNLERAVNLLLAEEDYFGAFELCYFVFNKTPEKDQEMSLSCLEQTRALLVSSGWCKIRNITSCDDYDYEMCIKNPCNLECKLENNVCIPDKIS